MFFYSATWFGGEATATVSSISASGVAAHFSLPSSVNSSVFILLLAKYMSNRDEKIIEYTYHYQNIVLAD